MATTIFQKIENFLLEKNNIDLMKQISDEGKPAIQVLSKGLKERFDIDKGLKMKIGKKVRVIMEDNGYIHSEYRVKISEKDNLFTRGSTYKRR